MRKLFFTVLFCVLSLSVIKAQNLSKAIDLLLQNNRKGAREEASKIQSGKPDYAMAQLVLTIAYEQDADEDNAFKAFKNFYTSYPEPFAHTYALFGKGFMYPDNPKTAAEAKALVQQMIDNPATPAYLKAAAITYIGGVLQRANQIPESKKLFTQLNDIKNWATVGTFENVSASGFNKSFGVLEHPEKSHVFTNYNGNPVKWFTIPDARNDRWLDMNYHHNTSNAIIYAQTFLQSAEDQEITLLLGVSGSVKLWVNDFLVVNESEERNTDCDVYSTNVKLQKGYNRILIQLGSSEFDSNNFMLRFADKQGKLLPAFASTAEPQAYQKAVPYSIQQYDFYPEKYFVNKIASRQANALEKILLIENYTKNEKKFEATQLGKELEKEYPHSTLVSEVLINVYIKNKNKTDVTREVESMKEHDPESYYALNERYYDAYNKEDYNEADKLLKRRIELYGLNQDAAVKQLYLYSKKNESEKVLSHVEKCVAEYPDNLTFFNVNYNLTNNYYKNKAKAISLLEDYLKKHFNDELIETLVNEKINEGKREEGIKIFMKLLEDQPYATMRYSKLGKRYLEVKDYQTALQWYQKTIDRAPYVGNILKDKAEVYELAGNKAEAIELYKKAIQYNPQGYDIRRKLSELEGKKDLFSYFKTDDISQLFKNSPTIKEYPNSNSIYLLKDQQQVIYPETGASEENFNYVIKILNEEGIKAWKEVDINYNEYSQRLIFDKVELLKKDGSKVQAETNSNQAVFSTLDIGDAIHISYKLENTQYGKLAEHFWNDFSFDNDYPSLISRFSIMVPANKTFQHKATNTNIVPTINKVNENYTMYVWEQKDVKQIDYEVNMPPYSDVSKRVFVSSIPNWSYVANWYSDLSNIKSKADYEIKETVKALFADKKGLTNFEKAKTIYNYIVDICNYSSVSFLQSALTPQKASRTLNSKLGDCKDLSVLFVAMAQEVGLDANLVLVNTKDQGSNNLVLPSISFNHCIAQFNDGNKKYYIELTDKNLPFSSIDNSSLQSDFLEIPSRGQQTNNGKLEKLNTDARPVNITDRNTTITINGNKADIERTVLRMGAESAGLRSDFKDVSDEDNKKNLQNRLSREFKNTVTLKSYNLKNIDTLTDTAFYKYSFTADKFSSEIAGMQVISLPWSDALSNLEVIALEKRTYPFCVWKYSNTIVDKETLTIKLPATKKFVEIPKNITYKNDLLSYSMIYTLKNGALVINRELKFLKELVSPAEYQLFKDTISKIAEADTKQLAFR